MTAGAQSDGDAGLRDATERITPVLLAGGSGTRL